MCRGFVFGSSYRELGRHFAPYIRDWVVTREVSDRAVCISEQHDGTNVCSIHRNAIFHMGICVSCLLQARWGMLIQSRLRTAFRHREEPASYLRGVNDTGIWCWYLFLFRSRYFADSSVTRFTIMAGFELEDRGSLPFGRKFYFLPHHFDSGFKGNETLYLKETRDIYFDFSFRGNLALCSKETRDIYFDSIFKGNLALCSKETRDIYFDSSFEGNLALCSKETRDIYFDPIFKGNPALCSKETRDIYFDSSFKDNLALCWKETRDIYFDPILREI